MSENIYVRGRVPVRYTTMLPRSTDAFRLHDGGGGVLLMFNSTALAHAVRGVRWHDTPAGCPTWTGGPDVGLCRCDVEAP